MWMLFWETMRKFVCPVDYKFPVGSYQNCGYECGCNYQQSINLPGREVHIKFN